MVEKLTKIVIVRLNDLSRELDSTVEFPQLQNAVETVHRTVELLQSTWASLVLHCADVPEYGACLKRTEERKCDAEKVFAALHELIRPLFPPEKSGVFESYVKFTKNYNRSYFDTHINLMSILVEHNVKRPFLEIPFERLFALVYWLFSFYKKVNIGNKKQKKLYNSTLYYFLLDLFVTLLVLKCFVCHNTQYKMPYVCRPPIDLPKFDIKSKFRVSPEHDSFQQLVLEHMLNILGIHVPEPADTSPQSLAQEVWRYFEHDDQCQWKSKGVQGVLRVVKDQSRYMSLRSPALRRNYVADKTRRELDAVLGEMDKTTNYRADKTRGKKKNP